MGSGPVVSVVMPVRDAAATIEEAVASIQQQTLTDWELIIVDDGSTDGTGRIVDAMARADGRIRVLRTGPRGVAQASNLGFSQAGAAWAARMDADDVSLPDRLAAQVETARMHPELCAIGCLVEAMPQDGITEGMRAYIDWLNHLVEPADIAREMFVESPLVNPSILFRRSAFMAAGGYSPGDFPEDYDLLLRLHAMGAAMAKVPRVLFRWRDSPGRLTRRDPRYSRNSFRRLKAHHVARRFSSVGAVQIWGAGREGRLLKRALAREGIRVLRFFDVDPAKQGRVLGGGIQVFDWRDAALYRDAPILCAVPVPGARDEIRAALVGMGLVETRDFLFLV